MGKERTEWSMGLRNTKDNFQFNLLEIRGRIKASLGQPCVRHRIRDQHSPQQYTERKVGCGLVWNN